MVNGQGAIVSRRAKAAQSMDDAAPLPLAKAALEGTPAAAFALFDGVVWRVAAARVPGNGAAVLVGTQIDDRLAGQFKSQVDADVTLIQGGKVLASSLAQAEERARVLRWAAAPSPGYGVLQIVLPGVGNALSGKLPRGASRVAVRGALVPLDSGVQAALTVPAGPYLGWLGRYQAFYAAALALFLLFSLVWGLLARAPAAAAASPAASARPPVPKAQRSPPELLGTDVGEPRAAPPPTDDVPWPAAEPGEVPPKRPSRIESLDPDVPAAGAGHEAPASAAEHPMWSADPFTPTPGHMGGAGFSDGQNAAGEEPETVSAEEVGLVEAAPEPVKSPPPPPADDSGEHQSPPMHEPKRAAGSHNQHARPAAAPSASGEFSFSGLLDEAHGAPPPPQAPRPSLAQDYPDTTAPGSPTDALLAQSRGEEPAADAEPFPGDEPTRVEPVSAALLDKLRERDEDQPAAAEPPAQQGWGSLVPEGDALDRTTERAPPPMEPAPSAPEANVTMQDFSMPAEEAADPDEDHWRETFDRFRELKTSLGEAADKIGFDKFATKLRKNRADLIAKHNCKGVRFSVYEKDGKAAIKASAIR